MNHQKSGEQIAIRLPQSDLAQARKLAERKGLGYQTLLKMLVHEGLSLRSSAMLTFRQATSSA
jgi:predicted DNA binding CopG/RHH family protein